MVLANNGSVSPLAVIRSFFVALWALLTTPIPNPLAYWFKNEFAPVMPRKWKRVIYIASIIAMTSFTDKPDFMLFEKINKLLRLSYKGQALWVPKFLRNMIWKPILKDCIQIGDRLIDVTNLDKYPINEEELDQICEYFYERTPDWINYNRTTTRRNDVKNDLRTCLSELFEHRFGATSN